MSMLFKSEAQLLREEIDRLVLTLSDKLLHIDQLKGQVKDIEQEILGYRNRLKALENRTKLPTFDS